MEKILATVGYLSVEKDEAYLRLLSKENFNRKVIFTPSRIPFNVRFGLVLFVDNGESGFTLEEFDKNKHLNLIDVAFLKNNNYKISFVYNPELALFLLDNDLCDTEYDPFEDYLKIKKIIDNKPSFLSKKEFLMNSLQKYSIYISEGGYDKPGDWSTAWIEIRTYIPFHSIPYEYDDYLQKILPNFSFVIDKSRDYKEYQFKSDLLLEMKEIFGLNNLIELKEVCEKLTIQIRLFFKLIYNEDHHWESILNKYRKIRSQFDKGDFNLN